MFFYCPKLNLLLKNHTFIADFFFPVLNWCIQKFLSTFMTARLVTTVGAHV